MEIFNIRYNIIVLIVFVISQFIIGCGGGSTSHDIETPYQGRLAGIATLPLNDELNIATDSWIKVYWPDYRYPPPPSFTFGLQKQESFNNWTARSTRLKNEFSNPAGGVWWFEPVSELDECSNYRFWVKDHRGYQLFFYFSTTCTLEFRSNETSNVSIKHRPEGAENIPLSIGNGKEIHIINTKQ
ncbi:MAG: hypothetical protein SNJ70_09885 [Armatimonadota bacterium]